MDLRDIYTGLALTLDNETFVVVKQQHVKMGRGGAVVNAKLKNLRTGAVIDRTIRPGDTFSEAETERSQATFLYADGANYTFMDKTTFDQFTIPHEMLGKQGQFLADGTDVNVLLVADKPVTVELPVKIALEVVETTPNVKGNTASGGTKPATLSTGAVVTVPLFIKNGDMIRVNTEDGSYVERVST